MSRDNSFYKHKYRELLKVIEDIKAEISEYKDDKVIHAERNEMIDIVLEIINKHIGKDN